MTDIVNDLADMDDMFRTTAPAERGTGGNNVPDGKYQARIDRVYFERGQKNPLDIFFRWDMVIMLGDFAGSV